MLSRNSCKDLKHYQDAIDQIDATIKKLEKIKEELSTAGNQLRLANNKAMDLSIKKLIKDNPTMQQKFEETKGEK